MPPIPNIPFGVRHSWNDPVTSCAICTDILCPSPLCTEPHIHELPCSHRFHTNCLLGRKKMDTEKPYMSNMPEINIRNPASRTTESTRNAHAKPIPSDQQKYKHSTTTRILKRHIRHISRLFQENHYQNLSKHYSVNRTALKLSHHHNHYQSLHIANLQRTILPIPPIHYLYYDNFLEIIKLYIIVIS